MKLSRLHIVFALAAVMSLFASCNRDEAKVIPRGKLAKIYAEMLVTDQWITSTSGVRSIADTSLVYEPILKKYGYTSADYRKSIDKYMDDPERFSRIFRKSGEILDARLYELVKEQDRLIALSRLPKITYDMKMDELAPLMVNEPYIHTYDSLVIERDSVTLLYKVSSFERSDTLYEGLRKIVKEPLEFKPIAIDSLRVRERFISRPDRPAGVRPRPLRLDTTDNKR